MYFAEYLIKREVITQDQLANALIYQVEHLSSFIRILYESKLITASKLIDMVKLQVERKSDLVTVLKSEKVLDEKVIEQIFTQQTAKRVMLGEALVKLKYVDNLVIEKMLNEYLREKEVLFIPEKQKVVDIETKPSLSTDNLNDIVNQQGSNNRNDIFLDEYLNVFSSKFFNKITKILSFLNDPVTSGAEKNQYLGSLYRELYILKGVATLANFNLTADILNVWNIIIEKNLKLVSEEEFSKWCIGSMPLLSLSMTCLWDIRENIAHNGSEKLITTTSKLYLNYLEVISSAKTLQI